MNGSKWYYQLLHPPSLVRCEFMVNGCCMYMPELVNVKLYMYNSFVVIRLFKEIKHP